MQLQQDIVQKKHIFEMERLVAEQNVKPAVQYKEDKSYVTALWCSGKASDSRSIGTGFDPH